MKTTWKSKEKILMLAVIFWSLLLSPTYAAEYTYIELKRPPGWRSLQTVNMNDNGVVIGFIESIPLVHGLVAAKAFIYNKGFYTYYLPLMLPVGWKTAYAFQVNKWGTVTGAAEVVGLFGDPPIIQKGFICRLGICTTMLPPWGFSGINAYDINDNDEVAGTAFNTEGTGNQGFIYKSGTYTMLLPPGWTSAEAYRINNNGVVLGRTPEFPFKWFLYDNEGYTELLPPGWNSINSVEDINDRGEVIGNRYKPDNNPQSDQMSFLYSDGKYIELLPPGWISVEAKKINNNGVVLGNGRDGNNIKRGFIYKEGKYTELMPPGSYGAEASDINDKEEVVCSWSDTDSTLRRGYVYKDGEYTELLLPGYDSVNPGRINNNGCILLQARPQEVTGWYPGHNGFLAVPK
jgi:hypothetical protein